MKQKKLNGKKKKISGKPDNNLSICKATLIWTGTPNQGTCFYASHSNILRWATPHYETGNSMQPVGQLKKQIIKIAILKYHFAIKTMKKENYSDKNSFF